MPIRKILIVDDSPTETHVLKELLSGKGYAIVTAGNGEEGVAMAQKEMPDLILMDVVMPGMNGFEATRALSKDDATKHIPVIMCTSKDQATDKIWGLRQGANDYFVKPVDQEALLIKIAGMA